GADGAPANATAIRAGKQMVLAAECDRPDRAFDRIVVEIDTAIVEEARELVPAGEGVADRFGQGAAAWDAGKLGLQPRLHDIDQPPRSEVTGLLSLLGGAAADRGFNCVEFGD